MTRTLVIYGDPLFYGDNHEFPFHNKSVSFPTLISKPAIWNLNKTPMKLIQLETLLDMFLMMYGRDTIDANKKQYYLPGLEENQ